MVFMPPGPSLRPSRLSGVSARFCLASLPFVQKAWTQTDLLAGWSLIFGGRKETWCRLQPFGVGVFVFHQTRRLLLWRSLGMVTWSQPPVVPHFLFGLSASRMALSRFDFLLVNFRCARGQNESSMLLRACGC